jgi:hypothetical protein
LQQRKLVLNQKPGLKKKKTMAYLKNRKKNWFKKTLFFGLKKTFLFATMREI